MVRVQNNIVIIAVVIDFTCKGIPECRYCVYILFRHGTKYIYYQNPYRHVHNRQFYNHHLYYGSLALDYLEGGMVHVLCALCQFRLIPNDSRRTLYWAS